MKKSLIAQLIILLNCIILPLFFLSLVGEIQNFLSSSIINIITGVFVLFLVLLLIFRREFNISSSSYNNLLPLGIFISLITIIILIMLKISPYSRITEVLVIFLGVAFLIQILNHSNRKRKKEKFEKQGKIIEEDILKNGEKILFNYNGIKVIGINSFAGISIMPLKRVLITNKRIIISSNILGSEELDPAISLYYKDPKEIPSHDNLGGLDFTLKKCKLKKKSIAFEFGTKKFSFMKYKIYPKNPEKAFLAIQKMRNN